MTAAATLAFSDSTVGDHRDADPQVAGLADQAGQAAALGADHHHQRADRGLQVVEVGLAVGVQADHHEAGLLARLDRPGQVGDLGDRHPGGRAGAGPPGGRGHAGGPTLGQEDALRAERGRRPDHRAEVARVGDPVQRDQQRRGLLQRGGDQVVERLVGERRHLQADALVQHAAGHPVQLGPADLQDRRCPGRRRSGRSR